MATKSLATTPTGYGRFIGRVGALAVALGIGAAIANSPGIAWAEDGPSATPGAGSTTGPTDNTPSTEGANTGADKKDDDDEDADGEDADDEDAGAGQSVDNAPEEEESTNDDDESEALEGTLNHGAGTPKTRNGRDAQTPGFDVNTSQSQSISASHAVVTSADTYETEAKEQMRAAAADPPAASGPVAPPPPPMAWAMLGWVRRELGHIDSRLTSAAGGPVAALVAEDASAATTSPLATPQQFAAERIAGQTAKSLPVKLMKILLRQQFLAAANRQFPGGVDAENMAQLDRAVQEYARAASFQQLLLDSMNPRAVTQVAPPHFWDGRYVDGTRILYDNPDTIYRFMGVNGASAYVIEGQFHDWDNVAARPTNVTFSVLSGVSGTTTTVMTITEDMVDDDGSFVLTVSREPADGRLNHLQLTNGSTIIAARDTLGNWNTETPMSLSITRVAGPPDSLFAQIGGFAFLGDRIVDNPLLVGLVSIIPPLPYMPPVLRGVFAAAILIVRGGSEQEKYLALATTDPETGEARPVNTVSQPASNAEFLANQLQSNGHFQLEDNQALVLTIDPGDAGYFVVPTYNVWTITSDYWNEPASLNNEQAQRNADGTYTVVISPTDPLAANWISTSDLNQGTLAIRFQDIDPESPNQPRIVDQRVMTHEELHSFLPAGDFITEQQRQHQLELRRAGFDRRWAQS